MSKTVSEVLRSGTDFLDRKGLEQAESAMRILLGRVLKCTPLEVTIRADEALSESRLDALRRGTRRVADGEPVQHIVGETDFMGHVLKVDSRALIPRPETEILVDTILKDEPLWEHASPRLVDFGAGSGCISIAIAAAKPQAKILSIDISPDALALAAENVAAAGLQDRISLSGEDLSELVEPESMDAVVSNPPYIATADCDALPRNVRDFEPRLALDGGPRGLDIIEQVVETATFILKSGGRLYLEIGADQGAAVTAIMQGAGFPDAEILPDLAGRDRIARGTLSM